MSQDVFISYAKEDRTTAELVCRFLEKGGISCWIAPRDILPGMTWPAAIVEALSSCHFLLVIFSGYSNQSPQMAREIERADKRRIPILPLRVEDVQPTGDLEYFLGNRHWLDAYGSSAADYADDLLRTLRSLLGQTGPTRLTTQPSTSLIPGATSEDEAYGLS